MLELTISDSEKLLLERTNLFNKNNIISFCLLLSYGNLNGLETLSEKKITHSTHIFVVIIRIPNPYFFIIYYF